MQVQTRKYPPPPGASDIPGLDIAGTIDALGAGVHDWHVGDRVCATFPLGDAAAAHRLMESGSHIGTIVLGVSKRDQNSGRT